MNEKLTRDEFIKFAKENLLVIGESLSYVAVKVNSANIEMTDKLKDQLVKEGKYDNTHIGFLTNEVNPPYSMDNLPIYGDSDRYVTKHFKSSIGEAIMSDLRERSMELLSRHHEFKNS